MKKGMKIFVCIAFACVVLALTIRALYEIPNDLRATLMLITASFSGVIFTQYMIGNRENESRRFQQKAAACQKIFNFFLDLADDIEGKNKKSKLANPEHINELNEALRTLFIWGSPNFLEAWNAYKRESIVKKSVEEMRMDAEKLFRALREELGHNDAGLDDGALLEFLVKPDKKNVD